MRYTIILLALCFLTLLSYAGGKERRPKIFTVEQLKEYIRKKDFALPRDHKHFHMMVIDTGRVHSGNTRVLFELNGFVYYGNPFDSAGKTWIIPEKMGKIFLNKVSREELHEHFPEYTLKTITP